MTVPFRQGCLDPGLNIGSREKKYLGITTAWVSVVPLMVSAMSLPPGP